MSLSQNSKILASDVAPKEHSSGETIYGVGSDSNYGHVKLSDSTSSTSTTSAGIAATPKAVKSAYDLASSASTTATNALNKATTVESNMIKITYWN